MNALVQKFALFICALGLGSVSAQTSCLSGWQYHVPISLTNSNSNALSNHQVLVTVNTQALIGAGKMKADGSDIRFTGECCTPLCFYVEEGLNTAATKIWVNVSAIPVGSSTISLFYGNTTATDVSDPECTFDLWDDFNGVISDFASACGTNTVSVTGSTLNLSWTSNGIYTSNATFPVGNVYTVEADITAASGSWPGLYWMKTSDYRNYAILKGSSDVRISLSTLSPSSFCDGHNWASPVYPAAANPVGLWAMTWIATGSSVAEFPGVGTITSTDAQHLRDSDMKLGIGGISGGTGSMSMDWIRVRKYAATPPTATLGAEGPNNSSVLLVDLPSDTTICLGSNLLLDAGTGFSTYSWSTGDNTQTTTTSGAGMYYISATDQTGCASTDSVEVQEFPAVIVDLGADIIMCPGDSAILDTGAGFVDYNWSNGDVTQTTTVFTADNYIVTVTDTNNCTNNDTLTVTHLPGPTAFYTIVSVDTLATFTDGSTGATSYAWDFGDGNTSTDVNPTHTYASSGTYTVCLTVTNADNCSSEYCSEVTINVTGIGELNANSFSIYPTPAVDKVIVESFSGSSYTYTLMDLSGKTMQTGTIQKGKNVLSIDRVAKGMYLLHIGDDQNEYTQRILVD